MTADVARKGWQAAVARVMTECVVTGWAVVVTGWVTQVVEEYHEGEVTAAVKKGVRSSVGRAAMSRR